MKDTSRTKYMTEYRLTHKKEIKIYSKEYYKINKELENKKSREYYQTHKKERAQYMKLRYEKNKLELKEKSKKYFQIHKETIKQYRKLHKKEHSDYVRNKRHTDINYRIKGRLSNRIRDILKGNSKSASTTKLLGCSIEFFKNY